MIESRRIFVLRFARITVYVAVAVGVSHFFYQAFRDLDKQDFSLQNVNLGWLCLASCFYLFGMLPFGLFWYRVLQSVGQQPRILDALGAYYISQLGKYVPGKAMVVVIRAGLIGNNQVDRATAAVTVFIETLTQMAVGAAIATGIIAVRYSHHWQLSLIALSLMVVAGLPTLPPIFCQLVRWLRLTRFNPEIDQQLKGLNIRIILTGWIANVLGWILLGLSLWAVLHSLPGPHVVSEFRLDTQLLLTAAVAFAVVAGFLSLIPGGIGVREIVLIPLLAHELQLGDVRAVVASVVLRLIWLMSELSAAGFFKLLQWWTTSLKS